LSNLKLNEKKDDLKKKSEKPFRGDEITVDDILLDIFSQRAQSTFLEDEKVLYAEDYFADNDIDIKQIDSFDLIYRLAPFNYLLDQLIERCVEEIKKTKNPITLINFGIGKGKLEELLLNSLEKEDQSRVNIIGIDIDDSSLKIAQTCIEKKSKKSSFYSISSPIERMTNKEWVQIKQWAKNSLVIAVSVLSLHHIKKQHDRLRALCNIHFWLKPQKFLLLEADTDHFTHDYNQRIINCRHHFGAVFNIISKQHEFGIYTLEEMQILCRFFFRREMEDILNIDEDARLEKHQPIDVWKRMIKEAGFSLHDAPYKKPKISFFDIHHNLGIYTSYDGVGVLGLIEASGTSGIIPLQQIHICKDKKIEKKSMIDLSKNECESILIQEKIAMDFSGILINRYPRLSDTVAEDIGTYLTFEEKTTITKNDILLGNGSAGILELIIQAVLDPVAKHKLLLPSLTFSFIRHLAKRQRVEVIESPMDNYHLDLRNMETLIKNDSTIKMVYICNPNNPTGLWINARKIKEFLENVPKDVVVVIDEAYIEFVRHTHLDYTSAFSLLKKYPNLIITRSFSKVWGLAGVRAGYAISQSTDQESLITRLRHLQTPYSFTDYAGISVKKALKRKDQMVRTINNIFLTKAKLYYALEELSSLGLKYQKSKTNFVMIHLPENKSTEALSLYLKKYNCEIKCINLRDFTVCFSNEKELRIFMLGIKEYLKKNK
jgi:histidinol-phosphate aminotransferase